MAHLTIAASEKTFQALFEALRENFKFSKSDAGDFGPFTAAYALEAHLEGGASTSAATILCRSRSSTSNGTSWI